MPDTAPTSALLFVHDGWPAHVAQNDLRAGRVQSVTRGVFAPSGASAADIKAQSLKIAAYRYPGARLMGVSALRARHQFLVSVDIEQIHLESDSTPARRARPLVAGISAVLRPPTPSADPMPFDDRGKTQQVDLMPGFFVAIRLPDPPLILQDAALYPECAPDTQECAQMFAGLTAAERITMLAHPRLCLAARRWQEAAERAAHAHAAPPMREVCVFVEDVRAGSMDHDGLRWTWRAAPGFDMPPAVTAHLPSFVRSLMPEANDAVVERYGADEQVYLKTPRRLMGLSFVPGPARDFAAVRSTIAAGADLSLWTSERGGAFTGQAHDDVFSARRSDDTLEPKISGVQHKCAAWLDAEGILRRAGPNAPFTILAKPDTTHEHSVMHGLPALEWACQQAASLAGVDVPEHALLASADGRAVALLSQRFDIDHSANATRRDHLSLDGTALLGIDPKDKYRVNVRDIWKAISALTPQEQRADLAAGFFDRFALAWALADGDAHAKNISVLLSREMRAGQAALPWQIRLSPAYDTVCTRAIQGFGNDHMALRIDGKDDGLSPKTWERFGAFLGVPHGAERAADLCARVCGAMSFVASQGLPVELEPAYASRCTALIERAHSATERITRFMGVQPQEPGDAQDVASEAAQTTTRRQQRPR